MAGAYFNNEDEARRLWRYLNLAHVLAFVGLSPTYTPDNLLNGFIEEHDLHVEASEIEQLREIGVEAGQGAYLQCIQWALLVISSAPEARETDTSYVHFMKVHEMQNEILLFRRSIAALYAYHFHPPRRARARRRRASRGARPPSPRPGSRRCGRQCRRRRCRRPRARWARRPQT